MSNTLVEKPIKKWKKICTDSGWQFENKHYQCPHCDFKVGNKSEHCPKCGKPVDINGCAQLLTTTSGRQIYVDVNGSV